MVVQTIETRQNAGLVSRFVLKLRHGTDLGQADEEALAALIRSVRTVDQGRDIALQGSEPRFLPMILEGWAYRYRLIENGKRQITAVYVPGDLCEPFGVLPSFMDCSIGALTKVVFAQVSPDAIRATAKANPRLEEAFWWDLLTGWSIDQERLVSLGRRLAVERIGHLLCELQLRLSMVGLASSTGYDLLITQLEMSDLLGLTAVHINRSLRYLKEAGLISLHGRRLTIHDLDGLRDLSFFDPSYLHAQDEAHAGAINKTEPSRR